MYLSSNPIQHQRTKHVEIDLHFVCERVSFGDVHVLQVPSTSQFADIFTKGLPTAIFTEFRSSLNIVEDPAAAAGGCWKSSSTPDADSGTSARPRPTR